MIRLDTINVSRITFCTPAFANNCRSACNGVKIVASIILNICDLRAASFERDKRKDVRFSVIM